MELQACIFDLDGVIVDTAKSHYQAWKRLANEMGFDFTEEDNEKLKGVSRVRSLEILLEIGGVEKSTDEMEALAAKKNKWFVEDIKKLQPEEILPGVSKFLIELREHGIKIALGSASKNASRILESLSLTNYFDAIIDGTKVSQAKPDPEVFIKGAEALGVKAEECIVFEDAQAGVEAAKNAGMLCIAIGSPDNLSGYDYIIPGFEKITYKELIKLAES
jgi:beta-phosphoglucomutase